MEVRGKTVLVTGGARRIGRVICTAFARRGARVVIHYHHSRAAAREAVSELRSLGAPARTVQADLASVREVERLINDLLEDGGVDVLVNSASNYLRAPVETLTEADWDKSINTNLRGPFFCALRLGLAMRERGGGKIINIGDWAGARPYEDYLPYCISKAGITAMTVGLAKALAPQVQVNCVAPGPILLPDDFSDEDRQRVIQATPLGRIGNPQDIASTVAFLVEATDFVTGATYLVDGGRSIA